MKSKSALSIASNRSLLTALSTLTAMLFTSPLPAFAAQTPNLVSHEKMTAVLRLQERVPLENLAQNVRNARAMGIETHYEPQEIRQLSGPTQADYDTLIAQLRSEGFEITQESPTHLWISVQSDAANFSRVFNTRIVSVSPGLHQNLDKPGIPSHLSLVAAVSGLDNTHKRHPMYTRMTKPMDSPGGILPDAIKTAYDFNPIYQSGVTGQGQDIAVATYDGFNIDDVNYFYKNYGINAVVDQVNFNGTAAYVEDSAMETQLDAEFSGMIATGANVHVFPSAANSDAGELAMFTAILDDNRAKVVNYSWGGCETQLAASHGQDMDKVFARAIAQGVNIVVASGDSGSDACGDGTNAADWPAAHPDVVAVGGTTLSVDSSNNYASEAGWSGSGGGISALWASPAYQSGLAAPYNAKRSFPDVSFNADPNSGQAIYAHSSGFAGWIVLGGTSMAAPQWSGFMALVGQARQMKGEAPLGFLNPIIYGLSTTQMASAFHDVTTGSNGLYSAGPGFDAVTGLGSMDASALLGILTAANSGK
jgi:kumamolisin